jgi:hypothetical protein
MFRKSCKCKTKICKCGKRKIGGEFKFKTLNKADTENYDNKMIRKKKLENEIIRLSDEINSERTVNEEYINANNITSPAVLAKREETMNENIKKLIIDLENSKSELKNIKEELYEYVNPHGIYEFKDINSIYCFSDIESNMPEDLKKLMFSNTNNTLYECKNLESNKEAIVFTGDLIDRGAYTIRNLLNMLNLKKNYPDNVILICGNRDINKIRMFKECDNKEIYDSILNGKLGKNTSYTDILKKLKSITNINFSTTAENIAREINILGIVNALHPEYVKHIYDNNMRNAKDDFMKFIGLSDDTRTIEYLRMNKDKDNNKDILANIELFAKNVLNSKRETYEKNFELSYRNSILRIRDMYANTLGSPNQIKFFRDEFEKIFEIDFGFTEKDFNDDQFNVQSIETNENYLLLLKFIAMMNMVMGKIRTGKELNNLPECLRTYDGLYIKYLKKCHIMAAFTLANKPENLYIASHSGIPYGLILGDKNKVDDQSENPENPPLHPFFYIPRSIGSPIKTIGEMKNSQSIIDNMRSLNKDFLDYLTKSIKLDYKYLKYVRSSASCLDTISTFDSSASPIVSSLSLQKIRDESVLNLYSLKNLEIENFSKIYNIFGHQPGGFTPYVNSVVSKSPQSLNKLSYHINLDISKAENIGGISNKESYVYLLINDGEDKLIGSVNSNIDYHDTIIIENDVLILKEKTEVEKKENLNFKYDITLTKYCKEKRELFYIPPNTPPMSMFLVEGAYYGMFGYVLVKATNKIGGGKNNKTYTKSDKRFMNGKRQMVIYLGKRGCKYVKTAGEYVSLSKFIKIINKNKKVITKR